MTDNVTYGPWGSFHQELEEVDPLDDLVDDLTDIVFNGFRKAGFDNLNQTEYIKDLGLINESIRSYLLKLMEEYHPLQDVAEAFFRDNEDGTLTIESSVDVVFGRTIEFIPEEDIEE